MAGTRTATNKWRTASDAMNLVLKVTLVAIVTTLSWPLLSSSGLPSYARGSFAGTNIAYYISWAKEVDIYGWYTPNWCNGFDLLRFYPPIALSAIYFLGKAFGSFEQGAYTAFYISMVLFALSIYGFAKEVTRSRVAAFLTSLTSFTIAGYVGVMADYWEYPRILGEAVALSALASLHRFMRLGNRGDAIKTGVLVGILALTHLIALVEFVALAIATVAYWLWKHYTQGIEVEAFRYLIDQLKTSVAVALAVSAWWIIPALVPFGIGHYLRIETPIQIKLQLIGLGATSLAPPTWAPTCQLPYILLGVVAVVILWKKKFMLPVIYMVTLLGLIIVYGQGSRLIPTLGLFMIISYTTAVTLLERRALKYLLTAVLLTMAAFYLYTYSPGYTNGFAIDNSYIYSDEYKVSVYLSRHIEPGEAVYAMYGPRLRGNAWINVFSPQVRQVLSCYMEGCLYREVFQFDNYVKYSANYEEVLRLAKKLGVRYLWVDVKWYNGYPNNVVKKLVELGILKPVEAVNEFLSYSMLFELASESTREAVETYSTGEVKEIFLTPSRIIGFFTSVLIAIYVIKKLKTIYQAPAD